MGRERPLSSSSGERRGTRRHPRRSAVHSSRVRGSTLNHPKLGLPIVAVVLALVVSATGCGGDDEGSETGTAGTQPQAGSETSPEGSDDSAGGSEGSSADRARSGAGNRADEGSGGAGAPRTGDAVHRRSLARYLAARYARTPWYPLIRRIKVTGSEVRIYMNFPPESDDESPPLLACTAVLSYGRQVRDVFVYGSPTPQGRTVILKRC
jgi:hypothetical protein